MSTHPSPKDTSRKFALKSVQESRQQFLAQLRHDRRHDALFMQRETQDANLSVKRRDERMQSEIAEDFDYEAELRAAEAQP